MTLLKKQCCICIAAILFYHTSFSQSINISGPAGSGAFGTTITVLANGNYVVTDPSYDDGAIANVGAVYLYNGSTHALIGMLKGSTANDNIGNGGITVLSNGNYVVRSQNWDNGAATNAGAATWCNGTTGTSGVVNSSNSLVGSTANDNIGGAVKVLTNGNYVVQSSTWNNGAAVDAGALTWGNGTTGISGVVSSSNSLVGSTTNDLVGNNSIAPLSNGNYVVVSDLWDNGPLVNAGAVTWCNGATGRSGAVSSSNSLVGGKANDLVGSGNSIRILGNGNYVIISTNWDNGAVANVGAVTFGNGTTGISGLVSSSNSLVGSAANDNVGSGDVTVLGNGNYVVKSPNWDNGANTNAGAVTFGSGTTGISGAVSSSNSLVGGSANNNVGAGGITTLSNGNYVVVSQSWDNGAATDAGAVTFGSGTTGISGVVSSINSLVGSTANDNIGSSGVVALSNGNYVVRSINWDGAATNVGAVTWCNGTTGRTGAVSSINSLVGSTANDNIGSGGIGVVPLSNGNYVVLSPNWDGAAINVGAATFGNGTMGTSGVVNSSNSLVGSTANDNVGNSNGVWPLSNGNYVVNSVFWDNGAATDAGAITWCNGTTGRTGLVSIGNSLVGSTANDFIGNSGVTTLSNGNYVVTSSLWDNGTATNAGAVTFGNGTMVINGTISSSNSLVGSTANDNIGAGGGVIALSNSNYVVISQNWDNGVAMNAGAVTFGNGTTGTSGVVCSNNSLVGGAANDNVGSGGVTIISNGNYVVKSSNWYNGAVTNAGALSYGNSSAGVLGIVTSCNSVNGTTSGGGSSLVFVYNPVYNYLIVGRPSDNIVTIYSPIAMTLANSLDAVNANISGFNGLPLIANSGCRLIATVAPNGGNPVNGTVNGRVWIEPSVPTHAGQPFGARHYEITPATNPSTATGRITLYFTQQEFDNFNAHPASALNLPANSADATGKANLRIGKYSGTSSNGSGLPATYSSSAEVINPNDNDIVWNSSLSRWEVTFDVTGFSGFVVQTMTSVLPLTLLEFNGELVNDNALLSWKTENEVNTEKFIVERSVDGTNYFPVGTVAALNRGGINSYSFTDPAISSLGVEIVYYRLKQTDIDGGFTYSRIVFLSLQHKNVAILYPNPATDHVNVTVTLNRGGKVQARIMDNTGKVVHQQKWMVQQGSTSLQVNIDKLAKGMYYLELKGAGFTNTERKTFIKL